MSEKATKTNRARAISKRALDKLIRAGRKSPALYERIAGRMNRMSKDGAKFWRQDVSVWLHEDESVRVEPRLGAGLLLLRSGKIELETKPSKADAKTKK